VTNDTQSVVRRIMNRIQPGAIILVHEGRRDAEHHSISCACVELLLTKLTEQGYSFVVPSDAALLAGRRNTNR